MTSGLSGTASDRDSRWRMPQRRGTDTYCSTSRSSTATGKRYECPPYLIPRPLPRSRHDSIGNIFEELRLRSTPSGPFSWPKSTPLGEFFRFVENVGLFLSAPE